MSESQESVTPEPLDTGDQPTLRERIRRPFVRSALVFVIGLIIDQATKLVLPDSIERLSEFNTQLAAGAKAVQPWYGVALFWEKMTSNWPADMELIGIPFFLLGRVFGAGLEAILLPLSEGPETALPALVGYGFGAYLIWKVYDHNGKELNLLVGIVGTILIGGVFLFVLQPVMILATGILGLILGAVSTNAIVLATIIPLAPVGNELIKHILEERAEAVLDKALDGTELKSEGRLSELAPQEERQSHKAAENVMVPVEREEPPAEIEEFSQARASMGDAVDGSAQKYEDRVFALKPVPQKLMILVTALGLVFIFLGTVAIFYDSFMLSIPFILLGLVFLIYLSPKTGARLRWESIKDAKQTDFFRWFSLIEAGSAKDESGRKVITFRPESDKFHSLVRLDVVLHEFGTIAVVRLSLAKAFVDDDIDGIFARDIAKSFIRSVIPMRDEGSVTDVANEIEYRHNFPLITGPSSERPQLPPEPTAGFLAFVGKQPLYEGTFSQSRIRIEQVSDNANAVVEISIAAGR